jgi:trehalose 6-phosphate phosphatase
LIPLFGREGLAALALVRQSRALLAFDFDGTLAPIVESPSHANMRPETKRLLRQVAQRYPCAIITGRAISDVRKRFDRIPIAWFIGNHGAEGQRKSPGGFLVPTAWRSRLAPLQERFPGTVLEDKGRSLSFHYRGARRRAAARRAILAAASDLEDARIVPGKQVVSLVPRGAPNKGDALRGLIERVRPRSVLFAGDDETDEDAFRLHPGVPFVAVRVGRSRSTHARFVVVGQGGIDRLLEELLGRRSVQEASEMKRESATPRAIDVMQGIWALAHALEARSKWMQAKFGITGPQRLLLRVLDEAPGATPGTVARQMWLDPGTVSRILKGLERLRLVERRRDPADGRRFQLELTPLGRSLNSLKVGTVEAGIRRALDQMKNAEIRTTLDALRRFTDEVMPPDRRGRRK